MSWNVSFPFYGLMRFISEGDETGSCSQGREASDGMTFQNKMESPSTGAGLSVASRFSRVVLVIGLQIFIAKVLDDTSYGSYIVVFAGANFFS